MENKFIGLLINNDTGKLWYDFENTEVYLGLYTGDEKTCQEQAAKDNGVAPSHIRLVDITTKIKTPVGTLLAYPSSDNERPGLRITLNDKPLAAITYDESNIVTQVWENPYNPDETPHMIKHTFANNPITLERAKKIAFSALRFIQQTREKNGYNPEDTNNLLCSELGLTQNEIVESSKKKKEMNHMTQKIPQTILNAWNATQTITDRATGQPACVNLSSIASLLIQECGRWTDQYASDFIITWHEVEKCLTASEQPEGFFLFAIRSMGVDSIDSFMYRIKSNATKMRPYTLVRTHYARVYALQITSNDGLCSCVLKNITQSFSTLDPSDREDLPEF